MTRAMTKYKYDAFISYRHTELDKYAAELLHKQLEAFRLPGNLARKRKGERTRINRVFRDKDELPLTNNLEDPIMQALEDSDFLIVICSPRLNESLWCRKEIETFISMHGREKVLAVLIEGEPGESFPEELLYREETVTDADGTSHVERIPMEPLAADIRGKDKRAMKKALKTELLRLLAPMFSLNYDDLRQRHRERRMKRILAASLSVGAVCLAFGTVSTAMALRIQSQKVQIQAQADEILQQNEEIQKQNEAIQRQNQEITEQNQALLVNQAVTLAEESVRQLESGDRIGAIQTAVSALTTYQGNNMPYTPEAQFALTESLHAYDNGYTFKPKFQMETAGVINYMKLTQDRETLVTYDSSQCLTLWDVDTGTVLDEIRDVESMYENDFCIQGNNLLIYINNGHEAVLYDIAAGQVIGKLDYPYVSSVYGDVAGNRLVLTDVRMIYVLDGETYEELDQYQCMFPYNIKVSEDGTYLAFQEEDESHNRLLHIWNLATGEKCPVMNVGTSSLGDICYRDGVAYILLNQIGEKYYDLDTSVRACLIETGELLWEYRAPDSYGSQIKLPIAEGATRLLLTVTDDGRLLEMADGTEAGRIPYGSELVGLGVYANTDIFLVFTRSGEYHMLRGSDSQDYYMEAAFQCHSQNVKDFRLAANGAILILPYQDNKVTYYDFSQGDLTPYEGDTQSPETETYNSLDAVEKATELGLLKAAMANHVFYDQEKSKVFVCYKDGNLEIYNAADMSLLKTLTGLMGEMKCFLGTDAQGNMYIAGYSYGYMLNPQCEPLATIEGLICVDAENNRVIIENSRKYQMYTVPIYTVEELLAKAEQGVL